MIVDAHCHAWRIWPYRSDMPDQSTRGSAESLIFEMDTVGVDRALVICARIGKQRLSNQDNNAYVVAMTHAYPDRLSASIEVDSRRTAEYHSAGARDRLIEQLELSEARSVTHYTDDAADDGWLCSSAGLEFFAEISRRNAVLSLHAQPCWQASIRRLAEALPDLQILVHHLGQPRNSSELDQVLLSARHSNIALKVSGFYYMTEATWDFPYTPVQEYFEKGYPFRGPLRQGLSSGVRARVLGDDFEKVGCQVAQFPDSAEDVAIINAATTAGTLVSIDIGYGRRYSAWARPTTIIQGDRGHIVIDQHCTISIETDDGTSQELDYSADDALMSELSAFLSVYTGSTVATPSAEGGRVALKCALACVKSARIGGNLVAVR